jgi:cysteinyl-tRNA synthetase
LCATPVSRALDLWINDAAFSQRDEQGIPTHDAEGNPIAKSLRKKLEKQHAAQQTLRDKYFK